MQAHEMDYMTEVALGLRAVRDRIHAAERKSARKPGSVCLIAVSKTKSVGAVRAAAAVGQRDFGENYVQEVCEKAGALAGLGLVWHFIGPLQSNKTRQVAQWCDWVHSIDRLKIAQRLSEQRDPQAMPLNVCIQVNVSGEASKSGVAPTEVRALALAIAELPRLQLRGLMCIPEPDADEAVLRGRFQLLARQLTELNTDLGLAMDSLSMGMSDDLELAIAEGASMVRIGTAIFGARAKTAADAAIYT